MTGCLAQAPPLRPSPPPALRQRPSAAPPHYGRGARPRGRGRPLPPRRPQDARQFAGLACTWPGYSRHPVPLLRLETVKPWETRPQAKLILSPPNLPSPSRPGSELGGGGGGRVGLVVIEKLLAYLSGASLLSQQSGQHFVLGFYY